MDLVLKPEELRVAQLNMAKELDLQIEQSNACAMKQKLELLSSRKANKKGETYYDSLRELCNLKKELTRLKLDIAAVLEAKAEAEKLTECTNSRVRSYLGAAEQLNREIEEANEEHMLIELARIEAERECNEIEAQRKENAARFSEKIEAARRKIGILHKEVSGATDVELDLTVTNSDLSVLQSEMGFVRAIERDSQKNKLEKQSEAEQEAAKTELARFQEEGRKFMASMDVIRKELIQISKETNWLEERENKAESSIQQLNVMLLRAKAKLDSARAAQVKSEALASSLSYELQRAQQKIDSVKKARGTIDEETERTKSEIKLIEAKIELDEERLQAAAMELEAVKASEAAAHEQLRDVAQKTMNSRNFLSKLTNVTISKSEYEYLISKAESARAVADKKVAAAQAWIEALKAEEKEIALKTEAIKEDIKELKAAGKNALADQKITLENGDVKALGERRVSTSSVRRASMRRRSSISSGTRNNARTPSITIKKRATVMPNLAMFLKKGSNRNQI